MKKRQLSRAQRIVIIIGLGFACDVLGQWMMSIGSRANFGWVAYAPLSNAESSLAGGLYPWVRFVIWMILIVLWTGTALLLLRERSTLLEDASTS
jgi:heme/copper-type cytochrome/quinol oxidase subunit 1